MKHVLRPPRQALVAQALVALLLATAACAAPTQPEQTTPIPVLATPSSTRAVPTPAATPSPTPTLAAQPTLALLPTATHTPTPAPLPVQATPSPTEVRSTGGLLEVRFPFDVAGEGEALSFDYCVGTLPFKLLKEGPDPQVEGEGVLHCEFTDTPSGSPITFHNSYDWQIHLTGALWPSTADYPDGFLDAQIEISGQMAMYYTGWPDEATNPCPAGSPCRPPLEGGLFPAPFNYIDGSTVEAGWIFVLHPQ
ncbi:MAG: hypothetical protein GX557_01275 [Chloroflexi bacterium]|nr:hypothetical protein [Chloroflexota bacterium]